MLPKVGLRLIAERQRPVSERLPLLDLDLKELGTRSAMSAPAAALRRHSRQGQQLSFGGSPLDRHQARSLLPLVDALRTLSSLLPPRFVSS